MRKAGDSEIIPASAKAAFYLGLGSLAALVLAVVGGFAVAALGLVNLLRSIVIPMALAAVIFGILARNKAAGEEPGGQREAKIGLALGAVVLGLALLVIIAVAVFSFLMLLFS